MYLKPGSNNFDLFLCVLCVSDRQFLLQLHQPLLCTRVDRQHRASQLQPPLYSHSLLPNPARSRYCLHLTATGPGRSCSETQKAELGVKSFKVTPFAAGAELPNKVHLSVFWIAG